MTNRSITKTIIYTGVKFNILGFNGYPNTNLHLGPGLVYNKTVGFGVIGGLTGKINQSLDTHMDLFLSYNTVMVNFSISMFETNKGNESLLGNDYTKFRIGPSFYSQYNKGNSIGVDISPVPDVILFLTPPLYFIPMFPANISSILI